MSEPVKQVLIPDEVLMSKIYLVRGLKVMLDRDLAELFDVKAIRLREQLKRNTEKFPPHFMFQLANKEVGIMVSQNAIPSKQHLGGSLPYVFTEHGVLQLANILKSSRATQVSIKVIEVFIKMREMLTDTLKLHLDIELIKKKLNNQDRELLPKKRGRLNKPRADLILFTLYYYYLSALHSFRESASFTSFINSERYPSSSSPLAPLAMAITCSMEASSLY